MATDAQIAANRANALHSTGPRTPQGKAAVRRNALKHGFYADEFILDDGERHQFDRLYRSLAAEIRPRSTAAWYAFHEYVRATWNLRRIGAEEADLATAANDGRCDDDHHFWRQYDRFQRARSMNLRLQRQAWHHLLQLQRAIAAPAFEVFEDSTNSTDPNHLTTPPRAPEAPPNAIAGAVAQPAPALSSTPAPRPAARTKQTQSPAPRKPALIALPRRKSGNPTPKSPRKQEPAA